MLVGGFRANIPNFAHRPREIWITVPAFMFEFVVPLVLYDRQCSVQCLEVANYLYSSQGILLVAFNFFK